MQPITLAMICCVTLSEFLVQQFKLPPLLKFLPEMFSMLVVVYVLIVGTRDGFKWVAPKYWLIFGALVIVVLCGVINNESGAGPLISGMRFYFRAAPLFFLGMVMPPNEVQLWRQFKLLLGICFLQLPVTVWQRWVIIAADRNSGDDVRGTIMDSGILSMFLICAALVLTGMMLKRRIGIWRYVLLFLVLLFPTTINETKVTVVFVPLGLFVTLMLGAEPGKRLRYAGLAAAVLVVFGAIFVPIYDKMEEGMASKVNIEDFFTDQKTMSTYLVSKGSGRGVGLGGTKTAHRGESIGIPLKYLAKDPVELAFGLGLGNVSPSQSGKNFEGAYFGLFQSVLTISFASFVLEFGIFGVILIGVLNWFIFTDSLAVARRDDGLVGALAAGWTGVVAIFMLAIFYNNFHFFPSVTFLYWYFSGLICARLVMLRQAPVRATRATNLQPTLAR
jgi:hypothetical protein